MSGSLEAWSQGLVVDGVPETIENWSANRMPRVGTVSLVSVVVTVNCPGYQVAFFPSGSVVNEPVGEFDPIRFALDLGLVGVPRIVRYLGEDPVVAVQYLWVLKEDVHVF